MTVHLSLLSPHNQGFPSQGTKGFPAASTGSSRTRSHALHREIRCAPGHGTPLQPRHREERGFAPRERRRREERGERKRDTRLDSQTIGRKNISDAPDVDVVQDQLLTPAVLTGQARIEEAGNPPPSSTISNSSCTDLKHGD
ncbi:unnamed protein product [Pleuronectes platessa]|uniref:Uncharacterized protein n=1 Tax=Pleuronectes platessa TaxID=8262 RepID=A0A9N7TR81_PLEPL|nr:unnamed protein product [Pleuronectes platessa]